MKFNIHAGHGLSGGAGCGAAGLLDESNEARKVKDRLIYYINAAGHMCYDCTYNGNANKNLILENIVNKCNLNSVDLDISIHLNSGRNDYAGDGTTGGVEVYGYDSSVADVAEKICKEISEKLGIRNRGFKINRSLYFLKKTKSKAILIECCFVDDRDDAIRWNADVCAQAIATALGIKIKPKMNYRGHIQGIGWDKVVSDGECCGTVGRAKRLEAIKIDAPIPIYAKAHIQGIGDVDYGLINSNTIIGTVGESRRMEAIFLKGKLKFRVHIQGSGWSNWEDATNGVWQGTKGQSRRIEAIEIKRI